MSLLSGIIWLIILLFALSKIDKGIKYLNEMKIKPKAALLPANTINTGGGTVLTPIKSDNYIPSTVEEQRLLSEFEDDLVTQISGRSGAVRPLEMARWSEAIYSPGVSLPDSVFHDASRMILCSNVPNPTGNICTDVKALTKDSSLYGLKTSTRIIFGFKMVLETEPCSAALLRVKLHKHFKKILWQTILNSIDFTNESREIIFVGYDSGGALASLAAWNTIKRFEALKPTGLIVNNGNNQVKVITWDELPLFTVKTVAKSPLLPCNHSRFTSLAISDSHYRAISRASGGIDEFKYFSTSGDEIALNPTDYTDFMARLKTRKPNEDSVQTGHSHQNLSFYVKEKCLRDLSEDRTKKLASILALHRQHLSVMHDLISNNYRAYLLEAILIEPNACAAAVANKLSNEIFPGSTITCRIDAFEPSSGSFKILCSYKTSTTKLFAQFLSFDAILGEDTAHAAGRDISAFMQEIEVDRSTLEEDPDGLDTAVEAVDKSKAKKKKKSKTAKKTELIKALRYCGPQPVTDNWSNCLFELLEQRVHLSLISPFIIQNKTVYPRVSYIPFDSIDSIASRAGSSRNTGCYLRAPSVSHELLQVYKADPIFFYRAIDPKLMNYPARCRKLIFHIPFKANDRPGLEVLQQLSVEYLTQLISKNPIADSEVTLWRPRDTDSFKTLAFFGSENITVKDLADRSNYEEDFENAVIKCLSSPSYPYRDCTNPLNRWVPMACPAACSQTHGAIDFLCKQVKSCPSAGYYIATSIEGTVEKLGDIHSNLVQRPNPQFGIFHVQTRGANPLSYFAANFNVGLFRLPFWDTN